MVCAMDCGTAMAFLKASSCRDRLSSRGRVRMERSVSMSVRKESASSCMRSRKMERAMEKTEAYSFAFSWNSA